MSHLIASKKDQVQRWDLLGLPMPEQTPTFKPVSHWELVNTLESVLSSQGLTIENEQLALRKDGNKLFGMFQINYKNTPDGTSFLGLRTSNDKTMAIKIVAGLNVMVCTNMVLAGDTIALRRKHTSGLNLRDEIEGAINRFKEHFNTLERDIEFLKRRWLFDNQAKAIMHDVFVQGTMPMRLMPAVSAEYFEPTHDEFRARNEWSLHNAFTQVAKQMPMTTRMNAINRLGRVFGLVSKETV